MTTYRGYLETPYLNGPYLGGYCDFSLDSQVDLKLMGSHQLGSQVEQKILSDMSIGSQVLQKIYDTYDLGSQVNLFIDTDIDDFKLGNEVSLKVYQASMMGSQVEQKIYKAYLLGSQVLINKGTLSELGSQTDQNLVDILELGESAKLGKLLHTVWERYLTNPYLTDSYLAPGFHTWLGNQVVQKLYHPNNLGSQVFLNVYESDNLGNQADQKISDELAIGNQVKQKLYYAYGLGSQVDRKIYEVINLPSQVVLKIQDDMGIGSQVIKIKVSQQGSQVTLVIYNITQLRILQTFVSRGSVDLGGLNWTSSFPMKAGDYAMKNVNTDIIEQRAQTSGVPAQWIVTCNTGLPQGAYVDTLAILGHNFTKSARIEFQGSNDPIFSTVGFSVVLDSELINTYWISPSLPNSGFIYWRLIIDDNANPNLGLWIGSIIFGSSQMMSVWENFENPIIYGHKHYKDSIETEGFTSVSNDRALRKFLSLTFNDIRYDSGNYQLLRDYFLTNKTDLKCLIIPRPTKPSAFAVFSKLGSLPSENHNAISDTDHWVSFTLDWDESL